MTCRQILPGDLKGAWTPDGVYLQTHLDQAGRRSVLTHELVHLERGSVCTMPRHYEREERAVDEIAARRLIPIEQLVDVLVWTRRRIGPEAAGELWCNVHMLKVRVQTLTVDEQQYIDDEIARRQPW